MLEPVGPEIWIAEGPDVAFFGFPYPTRMVVVRLADGGLWLWSPVEARDALVDEVAALGPVRHLVAPNKLHHLFLGEWARRFPEARLHAAPGLASRRRDLAFDGELGDASDPAWAGEIDQVVLRGSFVMDEALFFHRASSTALVCDLVQRFPEDRVHGWRGWLMRLDGLVGPDGSTPREWRASFWRRGVARAALERALAWDAERLVIAHGDLPAGHGRDELARGLRWLDPRT